MMQKILVTGANGMLGQDLCPILEDGGYEVIETDIHNLDITNAEAVSNFFTKEKPHIVIHCAAYTNVDKAEEDFETCFLINSRGTENVAKACKIVDATMVYISTDYVFDGNSNVPYIPSDKPNPINKYGISKYEGEKFVINNLEKYYICRSSWLYGHYGKNFVETMLSIAEIQDTIKVVDDQIGCPTWTVDLSNAILEILEEKPYGIYHTCGGGQISWYNFAKEIFSMVKPDKNAKLYPCTSEEYIRTAKRPKYSVLDNNGICRDWKLALKDYINLRF